MNVVAARFETRDLPLFIAKVSAGFPSPVEDDTQQKLNLHDHLVKNPASTFFVRVEGDSMVVAGIRHGDLLVVDRSLTPQDKKIVIAALHGELTVKRVCKKGSDLYLQPENADYQPIKITEEMNLVIWGVVTAVVHSF